ncbi:MAG: hypothetical protein NTX15_12005 [Candidatus Kapabacteria bacterium]|nr:hypothetical protein [Candidatus Kapabacteria bacterium]
MLWRVLIIIGILATLIGGAVWINDGMQIYTKDQDEVVTIVKDELFGTTRRDVAYVPAFKFGLLPLDSTVAATPACYGFVLGTSVVFIAFGWWKLRRKV